MSPSVALITTLLVVLLSPRTPLHAQSRVSGVVVDSLSGTVRPLGSAIVTLPGLRRWADADSLGRFTFHNVPAGRHAINVMHAALDALDVALPPSFIDVPETGDVTTVLAIPGVRSLYAMLCGASLPEGSSLLIGRVLLGDSTRPDSGHVSFAREENDADGVRRVSAPGSMSLSLRPGAVFLACDVPAGQLIRIDASTPWGASLPIRIRIAEASLAHVTIHVRTGRRRLAFSVATREGMPIADVDVSSTGALHKTRTNASGHAALVVAAGSQSITVQRVGYVPSLQQVDVARDTLFSIAMPPLPVALALERIVGRPGAVLPAAVEARRLAGFGAFLNPETVDQFRGMELGALLSQARGVTLGGTIGGRSMPFIRGFKAGRCIPNYFVDGSPFLVESVVPTPGRSRSFADLDAAVPPESILAVEVYASPVGLPPEFDLSSSTGCGTILIWTKRR